MFLVFANGVGPDDNEVRTGNAMVIDCYGRIIRETCALGNDLVVADLDASLLKRSTGYRWIKARRPELYGPLTVATGREQDTRSVRFEYDAPDGERDASAAR
jgi:predicted amidohydrolase